MKGLICGFLTATSAGTMIIVIKVLLSLVKIGEFELIYMRSLVACVIVSFIIYMNGVSIFKIERSVGIYAFGRVFGSCMGFILEIFSLKYISTSKSVLIINNPLLTSIISYLTIRE